MRVRPKVGNLVFKNNRGEVVDDMRFGDDDVNGDMDVRNNRITMVVDDGDPTEFRAQSFNGDIKIKNNRFKTIDEIEIISEGGDDEIRNNRFGESVGSVTIKSTSGDCESKGNRPPSVNDVNNGGFACME